MEQDCEFWRRASVAVYGRGTIRRWRDGAEEMEQNEAESDCIYLYYLVLVGFTEEHLYWYYKESCIFMNY